MLPTFETDHLLLTPLALTDAPEVQRRVGSWEIVRYMASSIPWPYPADGALTYIRDRGLPGMATVTRVTQASYQFIATGKAFRPFGDRCHRRFHLNDKRQR